MSREIRGMSGPQQATARGFPSFFPRESLFWTREMNPNENSRLTGTGGRRKLVQIDEAGSGF